MGTTGTCLESSWDSWDITSELTTAKGKAFLAESESLETSYIQIIQ